MTLCGPREQVIPWAEKDNGVSQEIVFQGDSMVGKLNTAPAMLAFRDLHGIVEVCMLLFAPMLNTHCHLCYGSKPSMDTTYFERRLCKGEHLWAGFYDDLVAKARLGRTVIVLW
jgi:hypothetical protein